MVSTEKATHVGFIRRSGIFIFLTFMGSVFELGVNGIAFRQPEEGGYSTILALFSIFFIVITPLTAFQFVVSKEISSYRALGEFGKIRTFVGISFRYVAYFSLTIILIGLAGSSLIADFMNINSVVPVVLLMATVLFYSPFPVLYGATQGLKRFLFLGFLSFSWGSFRFVCAFLFVALFSLNINVIMTGIVIAALFTSLLSIIPVTSVFKHKAAHIDKKEIYKAYGLVFPIITTLFCVMVLKNIDVVAAKKFFEPSIADEYACAARVGSAFFMLSSIIMVMFPHVSEEKTQSKNPIIFLYKSFGVTIGLSLFGIVFSFLFPGIVMKIITVGGEILTGAKPLIQYVGLAILPLTLVYIMSNYLLAKHISGFLPILICGMILQIILINIMHQTPLRMLTGIGIANTTTCLVMLIYIFREHRQYMEKSNITQN